MIKLCTMYCIQFFLKSVKVESLVERVKILEKFSLLHKLEISRQKLESDKMKSFLIYC